MQIVPYRPGEGAPLFEYWQAIGKSIPYFYPVSFEAWQRCLLADHLAGEPLFHAVETGYILSQERVVGMVQFGQPNFAWDDKGEKVYRPSIGIIRHLYFQEELPEVGEALLAWAMQDLRRFEALHAFYHCFGMGCNAYHGKLPASLIHVEACLRAHGFRVEHENEFYALNLLEAGLEPQEDLALAVKNGIHECHIQCQQGDETIGSATLKVLDDLTGGATVDVAYLTWFGITAEKRQRGLGSRFMGLLAAFLLDQGFRWLHVDTASHNLAAQRFYQSQGFSSLGMTRSYVHYGGGLTT